MSAIRHTSPLWMLSFFVWTFGFSASHQQENRPRIISRPSHPMMGEINSSVTFNWTFLLSPAESWNQSVEELSFGIWKSPSYLQSKLMVIDGRGEVLIRPNFERKVSCQYSMSALQVAFTLHNLTSHDQKQYGLHVEMGVHRAPLTDGVMLYLQGMPPASSRPTVTDQPSSTAFTYYSTTVASGGEQDTTEGPPNKTLIICVTFALGIVVTSVLFFAILCYRRYKRNVAYTQHVNSSTTSLNTNQNSPSTPASV